MGHSDHSKKITARMLYTGFACFIGGPFVYGWNINCVGLPGAYIKKFINGSLYAHYGQYDPVGDMTWQNALQSVVVLLLSLGGAIGGFMSATMMDKMGRKLAVLSTHIVGILAAILYGTCKVANSFEMLFLARLLVGFASGCCFAIVPVYATEITPLAVRGAVGTCSQLFITLGILISTVFVLDDTLGSEELWPVGMSCMAFFSAISAAMLIAPYACESPKWLLIVCRDEHRAAEALRKLYNCHDVSHLIAEIKAEANEKSSEAATTKADDDKWTFGKLFKTKQLIWPIILVVSLNFAQQFSGINVVFFYAGSLYTSAGLSTQEASYAGLVVAAINVAATLLAVPLIERFGRRPLLLYPMVGMCLALVAQVLLLTLKDELACLKVDSVTGEAIKNITENCLNESDVTAMSWAAIVAVALFVIGFAFGLGPIPNFSASELFRPGPRATAAAVGTVVNLTATLLVSVLFENVLLTYLGTYSFLPFLVISVLFLIFFWIKLPETKNRPFSEIYAELGHPDEVAPSGFSPNEFLSLPPKF